MQTAIVAMIVLGAAAYLARAWWRSWRESSGDGGCGACGHCPSAPGRSERRAPHPH